MGLIRGLNTLLMWLQSSKKKAQNVPKMDQKLPIGRGRGTGKGVSKEKQVLAMEFRSFLGRGERAEVSSMWVQ